MYRSDQLYVKLHTFLSLQKQRLDLSELNVILLMKIKKNIKNCNKKNYKYVKVNIHSTLLVSCRLASRQSEQPAETPLVRSENESKNIFKKRIFS